MTDIDKWTIRGVEPEAREAVEDVKTSTGIPIGRLVTMAIYEWYENLPEEDPLPPFRSVQ